MPVTTPATIICRNTRTANQRLYGSDLAVKRERAVTSIDEQDEGDRCLDVEPLLADEVGDGQEPGEPDRETPRAALALAQPDGHPEQQEPGDTRTAVAAALAGTGMIRVTPWIRRRSCGQAASSIVRTPRTNEIAAIRRGARAR